MINLVPRAFEERCEGAALRLLPQKALGTRLSNDLVSCTSLGGINIRMLLLGFVIQVSIYTF